MAEKYVFTFIHNHDCAYKDQTVTAHPVATNGAVYLVRPICAETLAELELVNGE